MRLSLRNKPKTVFVVLLGVSVVSLLITGSRYRYAPQSSVGGRAFEGSSRNELNVRSEHDPSLSDARGDLLKRPRSPFGGTASIHPPEGVQEAFGSKVYTLQRNSSFTRNLQNKLANATERRPHALSRQIKAGPLTVREKILSWDGDPIEKSKPRWQRLDDNSGAYVYSAHYDDVECPPVVRIVGIANTSLPYRDVWCRFYDSNNGGITSTVLGTMSHFQPVNRRKQKRYIGSFVVCPLTKVRFLPFAVTMDKEKHSVNTTFLVVHYSKLHQPNGHRTNFSRSEINSENVETDTESDCTRTHLDVKNTNSTVSGVPRLYNLTRCFPPFHGRYDNTAQVAEMIAASVVLGVDHFVFYVESVGPSLKQMLEMLKKDETAEVHPWNLHLDSTSVHYFAQYSSIQDCLYRHLHTSRYLLFGDPDELFVPRSHDQLLPLLDEQFTKRPECGAFLFRNTFFNLNFPTKVPPTTNVSEAFIRQYQLPALLHPVRSKTILDPGVRSKPAVAPRKISVLGVHIVEIARKGFRSCTLDPGDGLLHHYRRAGNAGEEDRVEDPYLWRYTDAIVKETQRILNRTI